MLSKFLIFGADPGVNPDPPDGRYMEILFKITKDNYGQRLDATLSTMCTSLSRNYAAHLIKSGCILVSGEKKKITYKLKIGETITGLIPEQEDTVSILPEDLAINIIHEDSDILVVNKGAGMVVHPAPNNFSGTLVNSLLNRVPEIRTVGEDSLRPGIVHRLDKDTTGAMVVAKNNSAFNFLKKEFKERRVVKKYLCIVSGNIKEDSGRIAFPIGRDRIKRKRMSTNSSHTRHAETLWRVRKRFDIATLVEAELKTGRTHQIRVHFRALGYPLLGDRVYGFRRRKTKRHKTHLSIIESRISRQMLHSWKLGFRHPFSGEKLNFTASVPDDMKQLLCSLSIMK